MTTQPTFREILQDLRGGHVVNEMRGDWAIALLYRLPSPVFSWAFLKLGLTPLTVSLLGLAISLTMPLQALVLPLWLASLTVFVSAVLFQIFDCADGTMARVSGLTSDLGADLDYLFGMTHYLCLYPTIGLLADRALETGWFWTMMGAVAVAGRLLARLVREQVHSRKEEVKPGPVKLSDVPVAFVAGLSGVIPFGALAGAYAGWVVIALLVYSALDIADAFLLMRQPPYNQG